MKEYDTNIKPADIPYTSIRRTELSNQLTNGLVGLYSQNKDGEIAEITENDAILETATQLSNNTYRLENPYITDLCCNIYTILTTLPTREINKIFKKLKLSAPTEDDIIMPRFWVDADILIKLSLGNLVNNNNSTIEGAERIRKNIIDKLMPLFNRKKLVPEQTIDVNDLKLSNGKKASFIFRSAPIRFLSTIVDKDTGIAKYEVELNGIFYPLKMNSKNRLIANTRYLHTLPNLSCILALGEDIYLSENKPKVVIRSELARRFIDIIQLSYNQKHNPPDTKRSTKGNKFILEIWGTTLRSLYPKAFRVKNKILKTEFIEVANLSSSYFHAGIDKVNKSEIVKENEHLIVPSKDNFCVFQGEHAIFTSYID